MLHEIRNPIHQAGGVPTCWPCQTQEISMKIQISKLFRLAATGAAGLALAQALQATTKIVNDWGGSNQDLPVAATDPANYGSNVTTTTTQFEATVGANGITGTPDIALGWSPNGAGGWQTYTGWQDRGHVIQVDGTDLTQTITFTPSATTAVLVTSLDFDEWAGGGTVTADWLISGTTSGTIASGTWTFNGTDLRETVVMNAQGQLGEVLTLELIQTGGTGSYFAVDNLVFDQLTSSTPIPAITSFTSDKEFIDNPITLSWSIENPSEISSVTLDDGINPPDDVTGDTDLGTGLGSIEVNPTDNTTYTLSVADGNSMELTILLGETLSLSSDTNLVQSPSYEATLSWEVRPLGADPVTLFDGTNIIDVTADTDPLTGLGTKTVTVPDPSTTYTVDANSSDNTKSTVVMRAAENSSAFSLNSPIIRAGDPLTVSWTGATANDDSWIGIYTSNNTPPVNIATQWNYLNGSHTIGPNPSDGTMGFTLPIGDYYTVLFLGGENGTYTFEQGPLLFSVADLPEERLGIAISRSDNTVTLTWESRADATYDIFASNTLEGDPLLDWDEVEFNYPSEGSSTSWQEDLSLLPGGPPPKRFYQVFEFNP